jgi:hypothetical protein
LNVARSDCANRWNWFLFRLVLKSSVNSRLRLSLGHDVARLVATFSVSWRWITLWRLSVSGRHPGKWQVVGIVILRSPVAGIRTAAESGKVGLGRHRRGYCLDPESERIGSFGRVHLWKTTLKASSESISMVMHSVSIAQCSKIKPRFENEIDAGYLKQLVGEEPGLKPPDAIATGLGLEHVIECQAVNCPALPSHRRLCGRTSWTVI